MTFQVYLNGKFLPESEAVIPVTDRGFLFGDGIFTTIKVHQGAPKFLELHLKRLEEDCKAVGIRPQKVIEETIFKLIEINQAKEGVWRLKILMTGGDEPGINLAKREANQCLMTLKPYAGHPPICRLISYPEPICSPLSKFKSLSYLDRLWIANYASRYSYDDALVCDHAGRVLETSIANVFWKTGKNLFYPDNSLGYYQGITLQRVLEEAKHMGMNVCPVKVTLDEIPGEEVQFYICNSLKGVIPVTEIDGRLFSRNLDFEGVLKKEFNTKR